MILRSDQLERRELEADVVVIGAGPAGLAVASRLATVGRRVVVLESGALDPKTDADAACAQVDGGLPYFDLAECRPRGLGGSTGLWGGWCEPLSDMDFQTRPGLTETGWCLSRDDLEPYYRLARSFCGIPEGTSSRLWRRADEPSVRDSPFDVQCFPVLGPRQLGRRHAHLFDGEKVDLLLDATVIRIATASDGASVEHVVVGSASGNLVVRGRQFVLAAGGIETARLLLASTSTAWPNGIGNAYDLVGRCFMDHPHVDAMRLRGDAELLDVEFFLERSAGTTLDGEPMAAAGTLVLSDDLCKAEGIGRIQLFIEPAGGHIEHPLPRVWRGQPFRPPRQSPGDDELTVITGSEQMPNRRSRVLLGEATDRFGVPLPVLNWELTDVDHRTVCVGVEAVRDLLLALGAKSVRRRIQRGTWPRDTLGGPHHLGTARMAASSTDGVVDGDCGVHGIDNLFVAGGAVFPTAGYAPPTLTIIALAQRLADHLAGASYLTPPNIDAPGQRLDSE